MVTLAQRIEELRTARGLSRPALAAALGFPRTAIEKFETCRKIYDAQDSLRFAETYWSSISGERPTTPPRCPTGWTGRFWTSPPRFRPPGGRQ